MTFLALESISGFIVSAGADGWVRYWSMKSIVDADIDTDTSIDICLEPIYEVQVAARNSKCSIRWILRGKLGGHYFIRDSYGKLWKLLAPDPNIEQAPASCIAS